MVRLTHLTLENIRSYRAATVEFREGVNAIVGRNGAGKSTLLQAIGYALFDSLEGRKSDFVREGSSSGAIAVGLAEDGEGATHEIVRELKKSGSADWFVLDLARDVEVCRGTQDVRYFVQNLCSTRIDLGLLYTGIIGIQQGEFARPFRLTRTPRQGHFSPLLEVEKYKQAFSQLGQAGGPKGSIRNRVGILETEIARLEVRLENRAGLASEHRALARQLTSLEQEEEAGRKRLLELAETDKVFQRLKHSLEAAAAQAMQAQQALDASRQQLQAADKELRGSAAAAAIVKANQDGHDRYLKTRNALDQLAHDLRTLRNLGQRKVQLDATCEGHRERLAQGHDHLELLDQLADRQCRLAGQARRYEALDKERIALEHRVGSLSSLRKAESSARNEVASRQARVDELTSGMELRRQKLAEAKTRGQVQAELAERILHLQQQTELANQRLEQIDRQLSMLNAPGNDPAAEPTHLCPVCNQPMEEELWLELVAQSNAHRQELQSQVSRAAKDLADSRRDAGRIDRELDHLQATVAGLPDEAALQQGISERTIAQHELDRAEVHIKEAREQEQRLQATLAGLAALADDWTAFSDNQRQIDRRKDTEAEVAELGMRIASLEAEMQSLAAEMAPFAGLEAQETALTLALDRTRPAYEHVLKNQSAAAQQPSHEVRHRQLAEQVEVHAIGFDAATTELGKRAEAYDEAGHAAHQAETRRLELDGRERQTRLEGTRQRLDDLGRHLEALTEIDARLAAHRAEHAAWQQRDSDLEDMRNAIRDMQPLMTRLLNRRISHGANAIHQALTNSAAAELTWDETFAITLTVRGRERAFGQLSGGEQMTAALAVNLAMLQELSTVGFAFFDEPTTNLDEDRRTELASRLGATRQVPQLIVISHDDTFGAEVDHAIRVAKTGNESEIQALVA